MIGRLVSGLLGKPLAWRVGRAIYLHARSETENAIATNGEAALIRALAAANREAGPLRLWDVGGHLGHWSQAGLDAAQGAGVAVSIEVFEPSPGAADHLAKRFAGNAAIRLNRFALGATAGKAHMEIFAPTHGINALTIAGEVPTTDTIEVEVKTGDGFRTELGNYDIHLVKIDAEGHDMAIVSGFAETLKAGKIQAIQFEYNHSWIRTRTSLRQFMAMAADWPYKLAKVTGGGLQLVPEWNPEVDRFFETNYALVREDMLDAAGVQRCVWNESNVLVPAR